MFFTKDTSKVGKTCNIADLAVKNGSLLYCEDDKVCDPPATVLWLVFDAEETNWRVFGFKPHVFWIIACP